MCRLSLSTESGLQAWCVLDGSGNLNFDGDDMIIQCLCANCGTTFDRYESRIRSVNQFCNKDCKSAGQSKGLVAPQRLGTGVDVSVRILKRKFYKYRFYDRARGYKEYSGTLDDFLALLKKCVYCGTAKTLGFDRIDNSSGHDETNIVVCCQLCNMTRGDRFTHEQMLKLGKVIRSFQ